MILYPILDAPLIIYKEKTLKTSGEILTKVEDDVTIELNNTNFDVPCDNDGDDIKDDDEDDDEFVEDVEETIPPAIIMNTAKGTKSSAKQTNKTKKRTDVRKKNYTSPGSSTNPLFESFSTTITLFKFNFLNF